MPTLQKRIDDLEAAYTAKITPPLTNGGIAVCERLNGQWVWTTSGSGSDPVVSEDEIQAMEAKGYFMVMVDLETPRPSEVNNDDDQED